MLPLTWMRLTPTEDSIELFPISLKVSSPKEKVFQNLVSSALDFTLDKFKDFVEKTFELERDEVYLNSNSKGLPFPPWSKKQSTEQPMS